MDIIILENSRVFVLSLTFSFWFDFDIIEEFYIGNVQHHFDNIQFWITLVIVACSFGRVFQLSFRWRQYTKIVVCVLRKSSYGFHSCIGVLICAGVKRRHVNLRILVTSTGASFSFQVNRMLLLVLQP